MLTVLLTRSQSRRSLIACLAKRLIPLGHFDGAIKRYRDMRVSDLPFATEKIQGRRNTTTIQDSVLRALKKIEGAGEGGRAKGSS